MYNTVPLETEHIYMYNAPVHFAACIVWVIMHVCNMHAHTPEYVLESKQTRLDPKIFFIKYMLYTHPMFDNENQHF